MTRPITLLILAIAALLTACGGTNASASNAGAAEPEHHDEGHGEEHHHAMPPSLAALHDVLAPTWHAEPGTTRAGLACTNAAQLDERSRAVAAAAVPEGVDAAAWAAGTEQLTAGATALVSECGASGPAVEERLSTFHDAFHALMDMAH